MLEPVLTVYDYYDGPVLGLADYEGRPHIYARLFDDAADDWTDAYQLQPIGGPDLALVLEDWAIWCRFFAEWRAGRVPMAEPYALPEDAARRNVIDSVVQSILTRPALSPVVRIACFSSTGVRHEEAPWHVAWHPAPAILPEGWRLTT